MIKTRGSAASAAFALSLLLVFSCATPAGAQSPSANAQTQGGGRVFRGWVGAYPVEMTLRRGAGGELSGSYSYEGRAGALALKGAVDARGKFKLEEFDGAKRTGAFEGEWREKEYDPEATLTGEWKKPGGRDAQSFYLGEQLTGGARVTTKRVREENKRRGYTVDAAYPQIEGAEKFNRLVEGLVTKEVADFRKDAGRGPGEKRIPGAGDDSLTMSYTVRLVTDELLSVEFINSYYAHGAAHPSHAHSVINYDVQAGRRLELADLFRPGADHLRTISSAALARLRKWSSDTADEPGGTAEPILPEEDMIEGASPKAENYKNWTLTRRGLAVTFDPYQVGPYAAGSPSVLIPYAELRDMLRPGGPLERLAKSEGGR